jgi:hypothetical protein
MQLPSCAQTSISCARAAADAAIDLTTATDVFDASKIKYMEKVATSGEKMLI